MTAAFDWQRLEVRRGKSGVTTVRIPRELLELARRETGSGDGWDAADRDRIRRWLLDQMAARFHLPVVESPGASWFRPDGEQAILVFLTR